MGTKSEKPQAPNPPDSKRAVAAPAPLEERIVEPPAPSAPATNANPMAGRPVTQDATGRPIIPGPVATPGAQVPAPNERK